MFDTYISSRLTIIYSIFTNLMKVLFVYIGVLYRRHRWAISPVIMFTNESSSSALCLFCNFLFHLWRSQRKSRMLNTVACWNRDCALKTRPTRVRLSLISSQHFLASTAWNRPRSTTRSSRSDANLIYYLSNSKSATNNRFANLHF